jgi:predicted MFS family arabinose efflux permease
MASLEVNEAPAGRRRSSGADRTTDENTPLLSKSPEPTLYRTLSRISEQEPLPADDADVELANNDKTSDTPRPQVWGTLFILLLGVFVANTDASLMLATYGQIASEFDDLENAVWLMSALILASCVAQPLYGKLSDIYGRKACLQASYILFALGTLGVGIGRNLGEVVAGRAVQGAGGAGMTSMVSIIITDLVPIHEVATLRAYVNVLATTGRSCGGVIGGVLTQTLGWRW